MNTVFPFGLPIGKSTKITFSSGKTFFISSGSQKQTESTLNTFRSQLDQPSFGYAEEWPHCEEKRMETLFKSANVSIDRKQKQVYNDHFYSVLQCSQKRNLMMQDLKTAKSQFKKQTSSFLSQCKPLRRHKIFEKRGYKMSQQSNSVDLSFFRIAQQIQRERSVNYHKRSSNINHVTFNRKTGKSQSQQIPCYNKPEFNHEFTAQTTRNHVVGVNNLFKFRKYGRLSFKQDFKKITQTSLEQCVELQKKSQNQLLEQISPNKTGKMIEIETPIKPLFLNFKQDEGQQNEQLQFNEQISNIEQDNSSSRYFDNDTVLPFINKISYENVDISNRQSRINNDAVPNIFVDFEKLIGSPTFMRRENRETVHFDSTTFKNASSISQHSQIKHLFDSQEIVESKKTTIIPFLPFLLITLSISILIMQLLR